MNPHPRQPAPRAPRPLGVVLACLAILGGPWPAPSLGADPRPEPAKIDSFTLPDQFGALHSIAFPRPRPLVLLVGDRRGSEEIDGWIEPLKQRCKDIADIYGIADVQAVPRFLRGRVTEGIRKSRPKPLLLDFEGKVTGGLPCEKKAANVFAISQEGRLLARVSGPFPSGTNTDPKLDRIVRALSSSPAVATP